MHRKLDSKHRLIVASILATIAGGGFFACAVRADDKDDEAKLQKLDQQMQEAYRDKEYEKAIEYGEKMLKIAPKDGRTMYNLGCLHCLNGDKDKALDYLAKAVENGFRERSQFQEDEDLKSLRGDARFKKLLASLGAKSGADEEGDEDEDETEERTPGRATPEARPRDEATARAAEIQKLTEQLVETAQSGDYGKALKIAEKAHELAPRNPVTNYNMACMHARLGHTDEALEFLEKAIELGMRDADQIGEDADLASLRDNPRYKKLMAGLTREEKPARGESREKPEAEAREAKGTWHVTLPDDHDADVAVPLIIALHGAGANLRVATEDWEDAASGAHAILLTPQGMVAGDKDRFRWSPSIDQVEKQIMAALDAVQKQHKIDKKRIVLAGFSQGASVALRLGLRNPERFRGVIAVAATIDSRIEDELSGHELKGFRAYLMVGEDDRGLKGNKQAAKLLKKAGAKVKVKTFEDLGHAFPQQRVKEQTRALKFVLSKVEEEDDD